MVSFANKLADLFQGHVHNPSVRVGLAFFIIFAIVLIAGAVINFMITRVVAKTGLSGTDRLFGVVFGVARGVLFVSIGLLLARMTTAQQNDVWKQAKLVSSFEPVENWLQGFLPDTITKNISAAGLIEPAIKAEANKVIGN